MLAEFLNPTWERREGSAEILGTAHTIGGPSWHERTMLIDGRAVHLTVPEPIFIETGDFVCVVGVAASSGVLEAIAYSNRSKGVSGRWRGDWAEFGAALAALLIAIGSIGVALLQLSSFSRLSTLTLVGGSIIFGLSILVLVLFALVLVTARRSWYRHFAVSGAIASRHPSSGTNGTFGM